MNVRQRTVTFPLLEKYLFNICLRPHVFRHFNFKMLVKVATFLFISNTIMGNTASCVSIVLPIFILQLGDVFAPKKTLLLGNNNDQYSMTEYHQKTSKENQKRMLFEGVSRKYSRVLPQEVYTGSYTIYILCSQVLISQEIFLGHFDSPPSFFQLHGERIFTEVV